MKTMKDSNKDYDKDMKNVKYIYDDDLWFFAPEIQINVVMNWESKINEYNKKLYYINPKIYYYQTT